MNFEKHGRLENFLSDLQSLKAKKLRGRDEDRASISTDSTKIPDIPKVPVDNTEICKAYY